MNLGSFSAYLPDALLHVAMVISTSKGAIGEVGILLNFSRWVIFATQQAFFMGHIYADVELINAEDIGLARRYIIGEDEIRRVHCNMLVDTGAYNLCINESIQAQLQLPFIEKRTAQTADGRFVTYDVVGPVHLKFKNRNTICTAMVLPGDNEALLGVIPLEDMPACRVSPSLFYMLNNEVVKLGFRAGTC